MLCEKDLQFSFNQCNSRETIYVGAILNHPMKQCIVAADCKQPANPKIFIFIFCEKLL